MERNVYLILLIFLSFCLTGIEAEAESVYGGSVGITAELADDGELFTFPVTVSNNLYYKNSINEYIDFSFSLDTGWRESDLFDGAAEEVGGPLPIYIVNPAELLFTLQAPESSFKAGRFGFSEPTGRIFTQVSDGAAVDFSVSGLKINIFGCYTGLQWKNKSSVVMSNLDKYLSAQADNVFASPRAILSLSLSGDYAGSQNFYLSVLSQADLNSPSDETQLIKTGDPRETEGIGGYVHSSYYSAGLGGTLFSNFNYSFFGTLETGSSLYCPRDGSTGDTYIPGDILAFCTGGTLRLFIPQFSGSLLQVEGVYSSGDKDKNIDLEGNLDGNDTAYLPVTIVSTGKVLPLQLGNTWYVDLSLISFPFINSVHYDLSGSMLMLQGRAHFRSTVGPLSVYGISTESLSPYLGTEFSFTGTMNFLSDLSLAASFNALFPGVYPQGALDAEFYGMRPVMFSGSLSLNLAF